MLNTNSAAPPPNFIFSCLPGLFHSTERPSPGANLVENENYLNILGELGESCVFSEPHFTCRVYGSTLSYCVTCLCSPESQRENEVEISSGDICVCVCVCESAKRHTHTGVHNTNTHTQVQLVSSRRGDMRDKSCLAHLSLLQGSRRN